MHSGMRSGARGARWALVVLAALAPVGCTLAGDPGQVRREVIPPEEPLRDVLPDEGDVLEDEELTPNVVAERLDLVPGLDLCRGDFPSEADRIEQRSASVGPSGDLIRSGEAGLGDFVGTRVIRYEPGGAARALDELRLAAARCDPDAWVTEWTGSLRWEVDEPGPVPDGLPADALALTYTEVLEESLGENYYDHALFAFRRGDVLVVVDGEPVRAEVLAAAAAERLAALEATDVGE